MKVQKCNQIIRGVALLCTLQHSKYTSDPTEPLGFVPT